MGFHKGNGGTVTVGPSAGTSVPVTKWTLNKGRALANTTNSTTGGKKHRTATVADDKVTFECPWDDAINPEATSFSEGDEVKVVLKLGDSAKLWTCAVVIIESVDYINDEDEDVTRTVVTGYANDATGFVYS